MNVRVAPVWDTWPPGKIDAHLGMVAVDVDPGLPLPDVLGAAQQASPDLFVNEERGVETWHLWLRWPDHSFYPDYGLPCVLDDSSQVTWYPHDTEVTLRNLVMSAEEGVLATDLDPLCFWARWGLGEGGECLDWATFLEWLSTVGGVAGLAATLGGLLGYLYKQWAERRADPPTWFAFVTDRKSWDARKLAMWLGIDREHARGLLLTLGYKESPTVEDKFDFEPDEYAKELLRALDSEMRNYDRNRWGE
ncbi:MAG: hypothetical protein KKI08_22025 [Armatimonadetes bacterium]|nr:hypothetical protein [Armatimonadota bacterium]